jgi:multidrug efflux pump
MILSNYAIKFRTAVFVFIAVLLITGSVSYLSLPREGAPDITIPYVFVTAFYEGTAPEEMEKLVTVQIEKQLNDVEGVKEIRSTSAENVASLVIEFMAGMDIEQAKRRVKDKVDLAKPDLPPDLDEPVVDAFNFSSDFPVYIFTLSGTADADRLKNLAEDLKDQIERLPGIKSADLAGIREREIRVEIDLPRMIAYRIPLGLVMNRIAQENVTVSAGNIEVAGDKFQVRIPGEFKLAARTARHPAGGPRRPAGVPDGYRRGGGHVQGRGLDLAGQRGSVRLGPAQEAGGRERGGADPGGQAGAGRGRPAAGHPADGGDGPVRLHRHDDQGAGEQRVFRVHPGGGGAAGVPGRAQRLFVGLAIPFSMLTAFTLMGVRGTTLNMIVLFSLVLAVGMLVDNAIVIVENIYRLRTLGCRARRPRGAAPARWPGR